MPTDSPLIGRTLAGRFRFERFLGEGAMARVYRGTQEGEPRDVAIKVMHPELADDPLFMRRFRREAKAASSLKHPNVVRIIDHGVDGKLAYIVMELLGGTDLFDLLVAEGRLGAERTSRIMIEVCKALSAAHGRGIIHRDLKPENVMLVPDPSGAPMPLVKVLDFGIAKVLERDDEDQPSVTGSALTNAGAALGTPEYMSPEQCEGSAVDARSDVYSAGAMMYRVITGRVPFAGAIPLDTMLRHLRDPPQPPGELVPGLHPRLEAVILKALAKRPADRHQSAAELAADLGAALVEMGAKAPPAQNGPVSSTLVYGMGHVKVLEMDPVSTPERPVAVPRPAPRPPRVDPPASPPRPAPPEPSEDPTTQMPPVSEGRAETLLFGARAAPKIEAAESDGAATLVLPTVAPVRTLPSPGTSAPEAAAIAAMPALPHQPPPVAPAPPPPPAQVEPPPLLVPVVPLFLITFSVVFVIGMVLILTVAH